MFVLRAVSRAKALLLRVDPPYWALSAALLVLFWPILLGGRVIFWGLPLLQFYPWHLLARQDLAAGFLPLWNPALGMGAPLLANAQSALLYPPNWLLNILPIDAGQGWLMAAHLFLAGAGMIELTRSLGIGRLGRTVAGLAFPLSGYLAARAWFLSINASVAWLPWIILAGESLLRRPARGSWIKLALVLLVQWLAGHWQTAWYSWLILAGWTGARSIGAPSAWKALARNWAMLLGASLLAFLLGAAQFLPTVEYWLVSQRASGVDPAAALTYSFWPWRLIGLVAPNFFGSPAAGNYWGYGNFWEDALYIGILPLVLAVAAVVQRFRRKAPEGIPYGYLMLIPPAALLLGMGRWTPIFPFLAARVPTFDFFQAPTRILLAAEFALVLLAAAGAEAWVRAAPKRSPVPVLLSAAAISVILAGVWTNFLPGPRVTFGAPVAVAGVFFLLADLIWLWRIYQPGPVRFRHWWPAAAAVVLAADLCIADRGLVPAAGSDLYRESNPAAAALAEDLAGRRTYMPEELRYALMFDRFFVFRTFSAVEDWSAARWLGGPAGPAGLPNLTVLDGIASANNFDSFVPARAADLLEKVDSLPAEARPALYRLMDVGAAWGGDYRSPTLALLPAGAERAWGVCAADWALDGPAALALTTAPAFDPAERVVLETGSGSEGAPCQAQPAVSIRPSPDPDTVAVQAEFKQDGFLVLADVNYPGWSAFLDGEWVPLLQADYAFRAVRVPAGGHTVEFRYQPYSFWFGVILSILGAIGMLTFWLLGRRRYGQGDGKRWVGNNAG